jgi:hypothetical protein
VTEIPKETLIMAFLDVLRGWGDTRRERVDARLDPGTSHPEFPGPVPASTPEEMAAPPETTSYDREQWRKKLKRVLGALPRSEPEWRDLSQEAGALKFGREWLARTYREEFALMVRKIVSDREVTAAEHHNLDLARSLMGISDAEAEASFHAIVSEAEAFFGESVKGA